MTESEYTDSRREILAGFRNKTIQSMEAIRRLKELEVQYRESCRKDKKERYSKWEKKKMIVSR